MPTGSKIERLGYLPSLGAIVDRVFEADLGRLENEPARPFLACFDPRIEHENRL